MLSRIFCGALFLFRISISIFKQDVLCACEGFDILSRITLDYYSYSYDIADMKQSSWAKIMLSGLHKSKK